MIATLLRISNEVNLAGALGEPTVCDEGPPTHHRTVPQHASAAS